MPHGSGGGDPHGADVNTPQAPRRAAPGPMAAAVALTVRAAPIPPGPVGGGSASQLASYNKAPSQLTYNRDILQGLKHLDVSSNMSHFPRDMNDDDS